MDVVVKADKKARERTDGAAVAVQGKHGDSCFAKKVQAVPKGSTRFGDDFTRPPALPCSRDDVRMRQLRQRPKEKEG